MIHSVRSFGSRCAGLVLVAAAIGACAGPGPGPFQEAVPGARSATAWLTGEPFDLAGPGVALSLEELMDRFRSAESVIFAGATTSAQTEVSGDGTAVGYVRAILPGAQSDTLRAVDTRMQLRDGPTGWQIVAIEQRFHCMGDVATELCR